LILTREPGESGVPDGREPIFPPHGVPRSVVGDAPLGGDCPLVSTKATS